MLLHIVRTARTPREKRAPRIPSPTHSASVRRERCREQPGRSRRTVRAECRLTHTLSVTLTHCYTLGSSEPSLSGTWTPAAHAARARASITQTNARHTRRATHEAAASEHTMRAPPSSEPPTHHTGRAGGLTRTQACARRATRSPAEAQRAAARLHAGECMRPPLTDSDLGHHGDPRRPSSREKGAGCQKDT